MHAQTFIDQLDTLLGELEGLQKKAQYDDLSDLPKESAGLAVRLQAAFDRMTMPGDTFGKAAEFLRNEPSHVKVRELGYLAYALRDELKAGWIDRITELVHADTSADMLEMADDLLSAGYKDPAVVVTGTAFELHVKALALKHGIQLSDANGKPKKADALRTALRQIQVTSALEDKRALYWMGLRNDAAHGNYASYSAADARMFVSEVSDFIARHAA